MKTTIWAPVLFGSFLMACGGTRIESTSIAAGAACNSIDDGGQTLAHMYESGAVYHAEPVKERIVRARAAQTTRTVGATLHVRAEKGMSSPYMHRVLSCHVAQGEAAHPSDPLHPVSGALAELTVSESKHGFAVKIVADNLKAGEEVWERASALTNKSGAVTVEQVGAVPGTKIDL